MQFKLLFHKYRIQEWKDKYFRYSHNKKILKQIKKLNKEITKKQKKLKKSYFITQKHLLEFQIKLLGKSLNDKIIRR